MNTPKEGGPRRVAALDIGEVRTGVAVSDPGGVLATPLEVVETPDLEGYLRTLLETQGVGEVVVGVPKTLGGEAGFQARLVLDRLRVLREVFPGVRFVEWDERFTTRTARASVTRAGRGPKGGRKRRGDKQRVDHLAAAVMLQGYLDRRKVFEEAR